MLTRRFVLGVLATAPFYTIDVTTQLTAQEQPQYVTVRATSAVPSALIRYVAQISEPVSVKVHPNERPEDFIKSICGSYTDDFAEIFYELNGGATFAREPKPFSRQVKMPSCLRWRKQTTDFRGRKITGVPTRVLGGEDADAVFQREIGLKGGERLICAVDVHSPLCGKTFKKIAMELDPGMRFATLASGDEILLPLVTRTTTLQLSAEKIREGLTSDEAARRMREIAELYGSPNAIVDSRKAPPVRLLEAVPLDEVKDAACQNPSATSSSWPYDAKLIAEVIKRTWAEKEKVEKPRRGVITIIDTGLDLHTPVTFLQRLLVIDPRTRHYGAAAFRGEENPPHTHPHDDFHKADSRWHGTQVAHIAAGGSGLREVLEKSSSRKFSDLVGINVYNLVSPLPRGDATEWQIAPGDVTNGVNFANGSQIANISIGSETELPGFLGSLGRKLLLVVAAGNEKKDVAKQKLFPAFYGGTHTEGGARVITVAGHHGGANDGKKRLWKAEFSNWGKNNVDLLAPGCAVPYDTSRPEALHGTSFAAPIVSMTAALLYAFGLGEPAEIKRRLHAAIDYDPDLEKVAAWSGRLNIGKALSLYDDFLVRRSRPSDPIFGRWHAQGETHVKLCAEGGWWRMGDIRKITSVSSMAPYQIRFLYFDGDILRAEECSPAGPGFLFVEVDEKGRPFGEPFEVPWADLADFVVHEFPRT